ncbi:MAG: DUF6785 family protein [Capsulimonadales bacterium]|nr:DUF6785 family protein [Capsulimonadales bacterium]
MTVRALMIAVLLTVIAGVWVRQSEILVLATQITESVPAIPGLATLAFLAPINFALRRLATRFPTVRPLTRSEITIIFLFVVIASMVMGIGVVQFLFALMGNAFYKPIAGVADLWPYFPQWLMPTDPKVLRPIYERAPDGHIPWAVWIGPGIAWCGFFVTFGATIFRMMRLFYDAWAEDERLSFPMVALPTAMMEETGAFYRDPLMWLGFLISAAYNGVNIWHAFAPAVPAFGKLVDLMPTAVPPWDAMTPVTMHFRPDLIGFGFLVSTEVSLTVWVSWLAVKLLNAAARAAGQQPNGLYTMEQGMGSYLALAVTLVWSARRRLAGQGPGITQFLVGAILSWVFLIAAGVAAWVSGVFLLLVLSVALVYGRLRAQTGVPLLWLYPYHLQKESMLYTLGGSAIASSGPSSVVAWTLFSVLSKGYFPTGIAAYQVEGMEMARRERFPIRHILTITLMAVVVGFGLGWYHHLHSYYTYGAVNLREGDIWGFWVADYETNTALSLLRNPRPIETPKVWATGAGAAVTFLLAFCGMRFVGFPFSPIGYAMSSCFGNVLWFSFLLVWAIKGLLLRYGGMRLYKRAIPLFLGLALGHLAVAGILWGIVGAFSPEAVQGYNVFFG